MEPIKRPPDLSLPIELPTDETLERLRAISLRHPDPDVCLLAATLARLCPAVESVARGVESVSRGGIASLDPDVQPESSE